MLSFENEACEYNPIGLPTLYRGKRLMWGYSKCLINYNGVCFEYDGFGKRIAKGSLKFVYDGEGRLLKQSNGLEFFYDDKGVLGFNYDGKTYLYRKNAQGDVVALLDIDGNIVVKYAYDAWGNHVVIDDCGDQVVGSMHVGNLNPFRYRGYYFDVETNLYYLKARYYDAEVGRFISQDGIEYLDPETINGLNLYSYCGNNPVMNVDKNGNAFISFLVGLGIAALIGAAIGAASYATVTLIDYITTGNFDWSWGVFFGSIIGGAIGGAISFATAGAASPFVQMLGVFLSGAVMTSGEMIGENISGDKSYSWREIVLDSVISGALSLASVGIMKMIKIPKLNSGRGSMSAISKQIETKLYRGIINKVSMKTFIKKLSVEMYNGIAGDIMELAYKYFGIKNYLLDLFD